MAKATHDILLDGTSVQSDGDFRTQSERTAKGTFQVGTAEIDVPDLSREDMRFPAESVNIARGEIRMRTVDNHIWSSQEFVDESGEAVTRWRLQKIRHQAVSHNEKLWVGSTGFPVEDSGPLNGPGDGFSAPTSIGGFQDLANQPSQLNDFPLLFGNDPEHQVRANLKTGHGAQIVFEADEPPQGSNANFLLDADWDIFKEAMNDTGFAAFEEWLEVDSRSRRSRIGDDPELNTGLRHSSMEGGASSVWDELASELDLGPAPNFSASPFGSEWSGGLNLDKYVRLREFAKTGDSTWLEIPGPKFQAVQGKIDAQIGTYSQWATRMDLSMEDFMAADRPEIADVFFVGLVHAGPGGFHARTKGSSLLIEGAVVSKGEIEIEEAPTVDFVYNRLYLDEVVKKFRETHIELDQVYFKLN